jgi:signal transduction histidine kinase
MSAPPPQPLSALAQHLASRREAILQAWREESEADPQQTTIGFLTRSQFNDHVPQLLDAFQRRLGAFGGADESKVEEMKHGLQRWQQGYRLTELMHEWGHLNHVLFKEIQSYAAAHPEMDRHELTQACAELIALISEGVTESASQYDRMQQAEAAGHLADLKLALAEMSKVDHRRAELIHQAVHDLRTNLQSVTTATEVILDGTIPEQQRTEFAHLVQHELDSVGSMLNELISLARLEAGKERRQLGPFDASQLIRDLAAATQPLAAGRRLFLRTDGPATLPVEGDPAKIRRILQNLISNALKYTQVGGLTLSWGSSETTWWVSVQDTGPGLRAGPHSPIAGDLREATDSAREAEEADPGGGQTVLPAPAGGSAPATHDVHPPGEGIGLSIVKRLCDLLDARLEMTSSAQVGTTFRIILPRKYPGA